MRHVENPQRQFGQADILQIRLDPKSRDDIPALLLGLQHLYRTKRDELFALLDERILPHSDRRNGRPGMDLWKILVLGVVKQGLGCDWDRLRELVNEHQTLREMLGHGWTERERYERQNLIDNVSLLTPDLLKAVNELIVSSGHEVARKKPGAALRGRVDSFVVETDVHYPTDVNLLWDAMRSLIRVSASSAKRHRIGGWRQGRHWMEKLRKQFQAVSTKRRQTPPRVRAFLARCRQLQAKAAALEAELPPDDLLESLSIQHYQDFATLLIGQVERRLLHGEAIPQEEKIFSIFEPHTRWISKGKAGRPVELGVPVCVFEDEHQFLLNHEVMWTGTDVDVAVSFVEETQARYPEMAACSFDRGFHSPNNRKHLDGLLELNALPKKGRLNAEERIRETAPEFVEARRRHPGVESSIHHLEHCGLDRVRTHGRRGFERSVALSVVSANLKRLGRLLLARERKRLERAARKKARARLPQAA
ncbi:MAG: ISNCY family transposase [Gammaproteobacteria bacterium]|nr:ISNCY family transposase [Gammaproteobacteria bacterium]